MNNWQPPAEKQFRYFLSTERLAFRLWKPEDLPLAQQLWGDSEVTRLVLSERLSDEQILERLTFEIEKEKIYGVQYWPIFERGTNEFFGCCGLRVYKLNDRIYELGFHLSPSVWGQGYATEAAKAVTQYGFNDLALNGIFAGHHPDNLASQRVLLKVGFKSSGAEFYQPTGLFHPSYKLMRP